MTAVELRPLLVIDVDVEPIVELGALPLGARCFVPFRGGTFEGRDGLRGTLGPGGVDWQVARPDGVGEIVDASEYYFRTHIRLATASPRLAWMNDLLAVSTGQRRRDTVRIDVHEVP